MDRFESSIVVDCPVRTVYNQWTQFEEFPRFMEGIEEVRQLDDTHQHWRATIGGKTKEWDAELTEQVPDQRIAWRSLSGTPSVGTVNFISTDDGNRTQLSLEMQYEPQGDREHRRGTWRRYQPCETHAGGFQRVHRRAAGRGRNWGVAWRDTRWSCGEGLPESGHAGDRRQSTAHWCDCGQGDGRCRSAWWHGPGDLTAGRQRYNRAPRRRRRLRRHRPALCGRLGPGHSSPATRKRLYLPTVRSSADRPPRSALPLTETGRAHGCCARTVKAGRYA